ncbi:hypothetical protein PENTCL1PPCAC_15192 [Pristionchus entomophagus]|uniref:G protein-coupled receptor n=1 Tax=Pristionchus entomophagus TaxID=358040 RepID=A0AAV5TEN8_9BILA|nr:hypothetical protein PENTCL1PPCAC_15192 [Pristionchus entomophagus]
MKFHLAVTNYVGSISTLVNGLFIILIVLSPPDNLGIFRSQYYAGAITGFLFAATQLWSAEFFYQNGTTLVVFSARRAGPIGFMAFLTAHDLQFAILAANFAARYAAIRRGWLHHLFTNKLLFYSAVLASTFLFVPLTVIMDPTDGLRNMTDYFFVCSYEGSFKTPFAHFV